MLHSMVMFKDEVAWSSEALRHLYLVTNDKNISKLNYRLVNSLSLILCRKNRGAV
jgi:hypothetical protein